MSDLPEQGSPFPPPLSGSPPLSLPRRPAHVSQIIVIEQGWSRVWGDLSLHPPSFPLSLSLSDISAHVVKWPASIFFFSFPLTLPVTQKSINSFQVRSKARYTVQVCPKPAGQLTLPLDSDQAGQMKGGCCHRSRMCEAVVNKRDIIGQNFNEHPSNFPVSCALKQQHDGINSSAKEVTTKETFLHPYFRRYMCYYLSQG